MARPLGIETGPYKGFRSWNAWNIHFTITSSKRLSKLAFECLRQPSIDAAATEFIERLKGETHTSDQAEYNKFSVKAALAEMSGRHINEKKETDRSRLAARLRLLDLSDVQIAWALETSKQNVGIMIGPKKDFDYSNTPTLSEEIHE